MNPKRPIIVADANIPFLQGVLDAVAEVRYLSAGDITHETVADADALLVRTRTHCNRALLHDTQVKFIATATIGFDHIDVDYCAEQGISWQNAPGCNADSVAQYVGAALCFWAAERGKTLSELTLGIVGVGHVGTSVMRLAERLGMRIWQCDPPREQSEGCGTFVSLETIAHESDVVTFHTPLTKSGDFPTYHLADKTFFEKIRRKPLIINSARGGVIDECALLEALTSGAVSDCVIDCWENEPQINRKLLQRALLATPHIAGYSADGKANATTACVRGVSRYFGLGLDDFSVLLPEREVISTENLTTELLRTYRIDFDSQRLKQSPETFEQQRGNYPIRRECEIR